MMTNLEYVKNLESIIRSPEFNTRLKTGLQNFPNLKLEGYIRNILVEMFNNGPLFGEKRAFAEFPRGQRGISVDFSICSEGGPEFTMEMKYQFPNDFWSRAWDLKKYEDVINKNFRDRKYNGVGIIDAFLLVVCDWHPHSENKDLPSPFMVFENKWRLNNLSQFKWRKENIDWQKGLKGLLDRVNTEMNGTYGNPLKVTCTTTDFSADFYFHFLVRNDVSQTQVLNTEG